MITKNKRPNQPTKLMANKDCLNDCNTVQKQNPRNISPSSPIDINTAAAGLQASSCKFRWKLEFTYLSVRPDSDFTHTLILTTR